MTSLSPWTLRKTMKKTKTKNKTDVTYETRVGVFQPISKQRDNGKLTKNMKSVEVFTLTLNCVESD